MIICRFTKNEYLQIVYLNDYDNIDSNIIQFKISTEELVNIESFIEKGIKRIENCFGHNKDLYDVDVIAEGQYCMCLYHANQKAVLIIKGETIKLHFSLLSSLKEEINKLFNTTYLF